MPKPRRGFCADNKTGTAGESRFATVVEDSGLPVRRNAARTRKGLSRYDFVVDVLPHDLTVELEVKHDVYEARSGNVAVEVGNPKAGTASGLTATTAAVWVFVLKDGSVWAARVSDLKLAVERACKESGHVRHVPVAGDDNAELHLFRRHPLFERYFFRLDGLPPGEVAATLAVLGS